MGRWLRKETDLRKWKIESHILFVRYIFSFIPITAQSVIFIDACFFYAEI